VKELEHKKSRFQQLFGLDLKATEMESVLREQLERRWNGLPAAEPCFTAEYSVDSSSASRSLSNGVEFFIIRALMLGDRAFNEPMLRFEMVKGIRDPNVSNDFERILRDLIEIEIVLENLPKIQEGSIVLIDGNLYGRFTHLTKELHLRRWHHLPLVLLDAMQRLFEECVERKVMLVGVSKFSKTRVVTAAMLSERGYDVADPDYLDVELLYRWKHRETGYTTPLLLGEYAVEKEVKNMYGDPDGYRRRFFNNIDPARREWASGVIEGIPSSPAIVMFHIIPKEGAQPMRVDIPACSLGIDKKIMDVTPFEFMEPHTVTDVVKQLTSDFGGRDVYNALLYVVDREVRLGVKAVDTVYKSVLGQELGVPIEYDRSSRRFAR
jgi:hypothetical protein